MSFPDWDLRTVFDNMIAADAERVRQLALAQLRQQINGLTPSCGHCDHWMKKSSCKKEAAGDKRSMNGCACKEFLETPWITEFREELRAKLRVMEIPPCA